MSTSPLHRPTTEAVLPGFYMTLREAAERLGLPAGKAGHAGEQRLRRLLLAREAALGIEIMMRRHGRHGRTWCLVTLPLLEEHCPELFCRRVQLSEALREEVERLEAQISLLKRQNLRIAEEVSKVRSAMPTTATPKRANR